MKTITYMFIFWTFLWTMVIYLFWSSMQNASASDWTDNTQKKLDAMVSLGWDDTIARELIIKCKETAEDPARCVSIGNFIGWAESSGGQYKNVFGVLGKKHKTKREAVKDWVERYNKYWYNMEKPSQFYGKGAVTGYCKSEKGHKKNWCPIGLANATKAFNFFNKIINGE